MSENNFTPDWLNAVVHGGTYGLYPGYGCDSRLAEPLHRAMRGSWLTGVAAADLFREVAGLTPEQLLAFSRIPCNRMCIVWEDGGGGLWCVGETYGHPLWIGREFLLENPNRKPDALLSVVEQELAEERGWLPRRPKRPEPKSVVTMPSAEHGWLVTGTLNGRSE